MFWEFSGDRNKTLLNKLASDLSTGTGGPGNGSDTTPPTAPANLQATGKSSTSVSLSWSPSTDNVGVTGYTVSYGANELNVSGTSATITGLTPNTTYTFTVKARDAAGNISPPSSPLSVTTDPAAGDTTPPTAPTNLQVTGKTSSSISLSWTPSTDNVGVTGYTISYGTNELNTSSTSATITGLSPNTTYTFTVKARDAAGNVSAAATVTATTDADNGNTIAPWAPNVSYQINDQVTYGGKTYKCLQAHTSLPGWEPANVPALWSLL